MRTQSLQLFVVAALSALVGCSASGGSDSPGTGGQTSQPSGGNTSAGNNGQGGSNSTPQGGVTSGGSANGGSTFGNGGASNGGANNGGSSGGSANGGSSNGGAEGGGKSSAGGRTQSAGGRPNGGMTGSGGSKGGTTGAGGTSSGGSTGTAGSPSSGKKYVGNITTGYDSQLDTGGLTFSKYWDQVTPENAGKWGSVQSSATAAFNWNALDAIYDYTKKHGIIFKQHTFIWGAQQPSGSINETNVKNWMTQFCQRYPETKLIDVVNEPPPHTTPAYANSIGGGTNGDWKWITNAFTWARAACPNAILILNDYNNIEWDNDHAHFIDIVKKIKAAGAPIDAVGCQAHDVAEKSVSEVKKMLDDLNSQTGLPIYITEYDVSDSNDSNQLKIYQQQFPMFWDTDYIKGITIWGWIYGKTWSQAPNSGLVNNGKFRPAMTWLMQQLGRPTQ